MAQHYDVIVVGAGIAGLYTALNIHEHLRVLVLSKSTLAHCNSALAQGGIAAVLHESDTPQLHARDTLAAGNHRNNPDNVRLLTERGAAEIAELMRLGVAFDRMSDGELALGLEGGHSVRRIAHCKDSTGDAIMAALTARVRERANVTLCENAHLFRISRKHEQFIFNVVFSYYTTNKFVLPDDSCSNYETASRGHNAYYTTDTNKMQDFIANACVIATGGIGQVYERTTNSPIATGDGIRFAYELGARLSRLSWIQFHPTAFAAKEGTFLISEAVRGEGARLLNADSESFLHRYGASELSTRDVVSRCILDEISRQNSTSSNKKSDKIFLDISHKDSRFVKERFPQIYEKLLSNGYDMTVEAFPITPCQHYHMGGIAVNENGETSVAGLYAVGECSYTGVHGNNRLASNSLLEAVVFGRLTAASVSEYARSQSQSETEPPVAETAQSADCLCSIEGLAEEVRGIMQRLFFIRAEHEQIPDGLARIAQIKAQLEAADCLTAEHSDALSVATVAYLILQELHEENKG
ncbi:MAG: FAD-dependent oxidoreductase [Oscillospiraceae bacterium]|nr:FAD-dependent oxidoreductase [Oscillospiraceae bacterium]